MRRVLAVRQDNHGDVILTGPAVRALAREAEVIFVCGPGGADAARLLPGVAEVVTLRADWIEGTPAPIDPPRLLASVAALIERSVDEAFVFTSFHQSPLPTALLLRLAGIPRIHAISVDYPGSLLDTRVLVDDDMHETQRNLALAAACGYSPAPDDDGRLRLRALPDMRGRTGVRYVAVQPGATVPARRWDPERMRAFVARLASLHRVVMVGSDGERELARAVRGDADVVDLTGCTSFAEFAGVIAGADALVVGNTSGIHVASATQTPVVTIFPPTIPPVRFAPWRVPHVMLGDHAIACAGCRARRCPRGDQACIGSVTPDDVLDALGTLGVLRAAATA